MTVCAQVPISVGRNQKPERSTRGEAKGSQVRAPSNVPFGVGRLPRRSAANWVRQGYSCGMKFLCLVRKKKGSISPFIGWSATS